MKKDSKLEKMIYFQINNNKKKISLFKTKIFLL